MTAPIAFTYTDDEVMKPLQQFAKEAGRRWAIGEVVWLDEIEERSQASHAHEFAWLKQAWLSLPENLSDLYATPEHLRKRALIQAGYYDEQIVDAGNHAAALRVASAFRSREEFSLVIVRGAFVILRTAKSQSRRAMKKAEFQASKTAILEVISAMIGVSPSELAEQEAAA